MTDLSSAIAIAVRVHRKQAGLSQKHLAEYSGVGKGVVFNIEHGKATVQLDTLLKVLGVLNIRLVIDAPLDY